LFRRRQVLLVTLVMLLALVAPLRAQDAAKIEIVPMLGHSVAVLSVAFSSDRGRVLSGGDKTVKLWDTATGALIRTFDIGQSRATIRERPRRPSQPETRHARLGAHPGGTP
jgi:WD40 repeat protein